LSSPAGNNSGRRIKEGGQAHQECDLSNLRSFWFSDMRYSVQACLPRFLILPLQWCLADVKVQWCLADVKVLKILDHSLLVKRL
jgi:hypothetical protein